MKKFTNEFKVGLFVLFGIIGLFYLTYSTGKLNIKKGGYYIYAVFDEIAGLENKAPVTLNGLEVGKVSDIKISYAGDKTEIVLKLFIESRAKIRDDAKVSIKTLGLMGEKYIQISSSEGKDFIKPGETLRGNPYLDLDAMMEQVQTITKVISEQTNKLLAGLNDAVADNKTGISAIVKNLEATTKNFEEFSDDLKKHPWKLLYKAKGK